MVQFGQHLGNIVDLVHPELDCANYCHPGDMLVRASVPTHSTQLWGG